MIKVSKGADWITKPSVKPFRICQRAAYLLSTSYWRICFSAARLAASAWLTLGAIASRPRPSSASPARIPVGANAQQKVHASVPTFRSDKPTRSKQTEIEILQGELNVRAGGSSQVPMWSILSFNLSSGRTWESRASPAGPSHPSACTRSPGPGNPSTNLPRFRAPAADSLGASATIPRTVSTEPGT